ncbi:MAG TPA: hypothetical protein VMT00_11960 [Thermoanaerobaculia bacterium]|nr:hypothetical protein [Thermoanaerobaculia bacterium]
MKSRVQHRESGQAAIEFVFVLTVVIALTAVVFQVLNFELDVFNKSALARYELFKKAKNKQHERDQEMISQEILGKKLKDVTWFKVLFQPTGSIGEMRYGPRRFYMLRGTRRWDPLGDGFTVAYVALLAADHTEYLAGKVTGVLSKLTDVLKKFQV